MGEPDFKAHLVTQICSISTRSVSCTHRHGCTAVKSHFIDWYRVLGVEENAGTDVIRKQYHKLALQLHPDKNGHPKAEIAFKLVSEAYTCIADRAKRRAFDLERRKNFCCECKKIPHTTSNASRNSSSFKTSACFRSPSRSHKVVQGIKDIRERLEEETKVIEKCLRANAMSREGSPLFNPSSYLFPSNNRIQKDSPVFNPSNYTFQGYPHLRTRICRKHDNYCYFQSKGIMDCGQGSRRFDTPIFEGRSEPAMLRSKSTCVRS